MRASRRYSCVDKPLQFLRAVVAWSCALLATTVAHAQNNASAPNFECECNQGLGSPPDFGPRNFSFLIDGRRYDISTYRFFRSAMPGSPQEELPSRAEPFFDSGMYRIIPEVEIMVGPGYGYAASIANGPGPPYREGAAEGFDTEIDVVDMEPPSVGEGLRVTTRVFTNECGAQAIYFEDSGTRDNFSGNVNRLPVLVRLRSVERDLSFTTFSTTYGLTNDVVENVIAYYPFTGWCIGDRGLESLDFEQGELVQFELTVYDYAGNAAEPRTQIIAWPIEADSAGGAGGRGGSHVGGGAAGAGETGSHGSGCSSAGETGHGGTLGLFAIILGVLTVRRRVCARER